VALHQLGYSNALRPAPVTALVGRIAGVSGRGVGLLARRPGRQRRNLARRRL